MPNVVPGWGQAGELTTGVGVSLIGREARFRGQKVLLAAQLPNPGSVTVQFNITNQFPANARARVSTAVNGVSINRIISVVDGATITMRGESVDVEVADFTDSTISTGREYVVGITAAPGERGANKQPPMLAPLVVGAASAGPFTAIVGAIPIAAGGDVWIPIDPDAGVISVFTTLVYLGALAAGEFRVDHALATGLALQTYDPREFNDWVPLAPNTEFIHLRNLSGAINVAAIVTFGIDG